MVTTQDILNLARLNKVFTRKDLILNLKKNRENSEGVLSEQLNRLLKSGQLRRTGRGVYAYTEEKNSHFTMTCTAEIISLNLSIKTHFPFANYCIWSSAILSSYMRHIPNVTMLFVDVERDTAESLFNFFSSDSSLRVFLMPTQTEIERYVNKENSIIIRHLISESPLQTVQSIPTPSIEKILVDIVGDVEFSYLQGIEIHNVYAAVFEKHSVNKRKLLRYAARRGRKAKIQQILLSDSL